MTIPLARPSPPRLSEHADRLREIEESGHFSNYGPVNTRFEERLRDTMFDGAGACLTVCNATLGLMLAIREATLGQPPERRFALMPSFTFAAAAQAAIWCGLTPLFCDIDRAIWAADPDGEDRLLETCRGQVAVVVPYATFGYPIDLARYERLSRTHGVPVVVDAAASLGTLDRSGRGFGTGFGGTVVYSMHATKCFATGEGGVVHSADPDRIRRLRAMANFGFGEPRHATLPGLNAKMSETGALLADLRLETFPSVMRHRDGLARVYRELLPDLGFQAAAPGQQAHQFMPALLPAPLAGRRPAIIDRMAARGIGVGHYFSPHAAEQTFIRAQSRSVALPATEAIGRRIVSLPLHDAMTADDVRTVAAALSAELHAERRELVRGAPDADARGDAVAPPPTVALDRRPTLSAAARH